MRNNSIVAPEPFPGAGPPLPLVGRVAVGDNRTSSQGRPLGTLKSRRSLFYAGSLPANETRALSCSGTQFYVTAASKPVSIRPSGGIFNSYAQGTGLQLVEQNAFDLLEVRNDFAFPVAFQVFVGFDQYLDHRLFLLNETQPIVARPTYPQAGVATPVNIYDISGQAFTDINGNDWYALSRVAIIVCNIDAGVTYLLQHRATAGAAENAIAAVYPQTSLRLEVSGDYRVATGGAAVNAIISELYNAIPA